MRCSRWETGSAQSNEHEAGTVLVCTAYDASLDDPPSIYPQILENWRTKRTIDPQRVDEVMHILSTRQSQAADTPATSAPNTAPPHSKGPSVGDTHLSRGEIFKRIEEDRERHKRLRERRWVQAQPQAAVPSSSAAYTPYGLASFHPLSDTENTELALDIEFENEWEATSDWNEDDVEAVVEERELCYPHLRKRADGGMELAEDEGGEEPMDLS
jgi:CTD kinase subunit gamma